MSSCKRSAGVKTMIIGLILVFVLNVFVRVIYEPKVQYRFEYLSGNNHMVMKSDY